MLSAMSRAVIGACVSLEGEMRPDALLFGEGGSRVIVSAEPAQAAAVIAIARELGAPAREIGRVGGRNLMINAVLGVDLAELYQRWTHALPALMGEE